MFQNVILIIIIFIVVSFDATAQNTYITGKITETNADKVVESASVVVKHGNQILGYTYSDAEGNYQIIFNKSNLYEVTLEANSLGFYAASIIININDEKTNIKQDFYLSEKAETLSTVVLKPSEKIKINRDTISFRISAFKDNSERTVEDMLKKLPGIEVADDGTIRALGKPIQKILIEGDDLADANYKVISKNLDVDVLEKIEIISNYDENPVLKQFLNSENVVLNLKLKKNKKSVLFGKVEVGGGIENRFLGDLNIGLINPVIKFLDLANANNIGNPGETRFGNYSYAPTGFNDFNKNFDIKSEPLIYLDGSTIELEDKNYIENTSYSNNLLINKRFSDSLKVRNSLYFYDDSFEKQYLGKYRYFVEPEDIIFTEQNFFDKNNLNFNNDLKLTFTPSKNTNITFSNTLTLINQKDNNRLFFNEEKIKQNIHNKIREQETHFQYSQKINNGAGVIDLFTGSKKLEQIFQIFPNTFIADSLNSNSFIVSNYNTTLDYQGLDASLIFKNDKTAYSFTGGFKHLDETIKSESYAGFQTLVTKVDSLSRRNEAISYIPHLQFKLEKEIYTDFFLFLNLDAIWNNYKKNNFSRSFFLPNPSTGFRISKTKSGSYRFNYSYNTEIPRLISFTENFLIKSYRSLSIGALSPEPLKSHYFNFNYTLAKVEKRILINISATHRKFLNQLSFTNLLSQNIDVKQTLYTPGQKLWLFQAGITSYIDAVETSIKFGYQIQLSEQPVIINGINTELKNKTSQYFMTGTTYFPGLINFKFLANYTLNEGSNNDIEVKNERYKFQLKSIFNINKELIATFESQGYIVSKLFYETNNTSMDYSPKGKDWSLGLKVLNIFNEKKYVFENSTEFIQSSTVFEAVPRYVILYGRFRF